MLVLMKHSPSSANFLYAGILFFLSPWESIQSSDSPSLKWHVLSCKDAQVNSFSLNLHEFYAFENECINVEVGKNVFVQVKLPRNTGAFSNSFLQCSSFVRDVSKIKYRDTRFGGLSIIHVNFNYEIINCEWISFMCAGAVMDWLTFGKKSISCFGR